MSATTKPIECYEHRHHKHKRPCTVCPVCGQECGMRGGIGQHMKMHIERREVTYVRIPRPAFDNYVDLPDGRRFRI